MRTHAPNPLRLDPSRTATLRRAFVSGVSGYLGRFAAAAARGQLMPNVAHVAPLVRKHLRAAYTLGLGRAFDDVRKPALHLATSDRYAGAREEFVRNTRRGGADAFVVNAVGRLALAVNDLGSAIRSIIGAGVAKGQSPRTVARDLSRLAGVGKNRALLIAQTEVIRAHAEAQLDGLEALGVEGVEADAEFSTTGDKKVCPRCLALAGRVFSLAEARGVIPIHPRCRCSWIPVVRETDAPLAANVALLPLSVAFPDVDQSYNWDCGAAVLRAVAEWYGVAEGRGEWWFIRLLGSDPIAGTRVAELVAGAAKLGLAVETFEDGPDAAILRRHLAAGRPVITPVQMWGATPEHDGEDIRNENGHYVVALAVERGVVVFEDPVQRGRGRLPLAEFITAWHDADIGGEVYTRYGLAFTGAT